MRFRISSLSPGADADTHRAGAASAAGLCIAVLLALHPSPAVAQSWARGAPSFDAPMEPVAEPAPPPPPPAPPVVRRPKLADFQQTPASPEVKQVAHWVVDSGDNRGMPYMIVDKVNATVFVFDAGGQLKGADPALLGMTPGDGTAKGIGDQKLSAIRPEDRTTPAGRFEASLARDLHGQDILWIDYASALSLHRVVKGTPGERRAERLQSETAQDNRISYGCINVPVKFFDKIVGPVFTRSSGIVYILPEKGTAHDLFGAYDVDVAPQVDGPGS